MNPSADSQAPRGFRLRSDAQGILVRYSHALFGDALLIAGGLAFGALFTYGAWVSRADRVQAGMVLLMAAIGYGIAAIRLWHTVQVDTYRVEAGALTRSRSPFTSLRRTVRLEPAQVRDVTTRKLEFMGRRGRTTRWIVEAVLRSGGLVELGRFIEETEARWLTGVLRQALGTARAGRGFERRGQ